MKQSVTFGAQLLGGGRYGCNNGRYGWTIVMSYIEINKAVSQWLLTFNLCVSVTWPLTCAFHIPCTHTPEIIDMHRGVCDNAVKRYVLNLRHDDVINWKHVFHVAGHLCGEFTPPAQRPVTRSCDVFFNLHLNKRLSKQSWGLWFETPSSSLWRHSNAYTTSRGKCIGVFHIPIIITICLQLDY